MFCIVCLVFQEGVFESDSEVMMTPKTLSKFLKIHPRGDLEEGQASDGKVVEREAAEDQATESGAPEGAPRECEAAEDQVMEGEPTESAVPEGEPREGQAAKGQGTMANILPPKANSLPHRADLPAAVRKLFEGSGKASVARKLELPPVVGEKHHNMYV